MPTRHSRTLQLVALASLICGILATTITDPAQYGLTDVAMHWISLASLILTSVTAWLSTPPTRHAPRAPHVKRDIDTAPKG